MTSSPPFSIAASTGGRARTSDDAGEQSASRRDGRQRPLARLLVLAAGFGIASGLAEAGACAVLRLVPDPRGWRSDLLPQILWIAPLVNGALFLVVGGLLAPLRARLTGVRTDAIACALFAWLTAYAPLAAFGRFAAITSVLLASGVATQAYRYMRRRPPTTITLARCLAGLLVVTAAAALLGGALARRGPSASRAARAARADAPNVLLVVLDTLRADHLSGYGYERPTTPGLDRLASQGAAFDRAVAAASWTLPSHASIFTGRYPAEHRAGPSPLDDRYPTLGEYLSRHGYVTGGFVANTYYCGPRTGLDRGFDTYEAYFTNPTDMVWRTVYGRILLRLLPRVGYYDIPGRKPASEVNREFLAWLDAAHPAPFFAFLNYLDTHDPYIPPDPQGARYSSHPHRGDRVNSELYPRDFVGGRTLSAPEIQHEIDGYDAALTYLDSQLSALFDELGHRGLLDRTLIIVTSDHGESFGNHGLYGHGNSLYRELIHVPLIVRLPGEVPAGLRVAEPVSLQAIPATVARLVGLASDSPFPGESLAMHWMETGPVGPDFAFSEATPGIVPNPAYPLGRRGAIASVSTGKWHLLLHEEGTVELFDHADLDEAHNLASAPENLAVVQELAAKIGGVVTPTGTAVSWAFRAAQEPHAADNS